MMNNPIDQVQPTVLKLPSPTGSAYGEQWAIKLQAGLTYHTIEIVTNLKHVGTIEKISIDIDGEDKWYAPNTMLDRVDKAFKKHQQEGRFVLDLSKYEYRSLLGVYRTQLITGLEEDVTLKIQFGAKGTNDPTIPTLKAKAWVTNSPNLNDRFGGRYFIPTSYELIQNSPASGEHKWQFPSGAPNKHIQRIWFDESQTQISKIMIKRDNRILHEVDRSDLDYQLQRYAGVALQSGWCLLDLTVLGFAINGAMSTQGLEFVFELNNPGAIRTFVQGYNQTRPFPQAKAA